MVRWGHLGFRRARLTLALNDVIFMAAWLVAGGDLVAGGHR
jgi:hypothetical protein